MSLTQFIVLALATWKIANFVYDDKQAGPFGFLHWLRYKIGIRYDDRQRKAVVAKPRWKSQLAEMHLCIYCMSFWYGLVAAIVWIVVPYKEAVFYTALPFALAAAVVIFQKMSSRN